ncbi:MAG: sulfotransferase family 2 domain-containing protein [Proteobacteria bacterium]|nr:sulfotransferase family 2 domain-containing protein [Pseudomonadota bacterium]
MSDSIIIFDSVEKTAGTSIKHLLRFNIEQESFFDYDNGDPPTIALHNYGIQCDAGGEPPYDEFRDNRGRWLSENHKNYDLKCVYGHGLWQGAVPIDELLGDTDKTLKFYSFLREPTRRIVSEYYYLLTNLTHPHHEYAQKASNVMEWFVSPDRPKNRQTQGILGKKVKPDAHRAIRKLFDEYDFFGLTENMTESIYLFCKKAGLKNIIVPHLNKTKKPPLTDDIYNRIKRLSYSLDSEDYTLYDAAKEFFLAMLNTLSEKDKYGIGDLKWFMDKSNVECFNQVRNSEIIPVEHAEFLREYSERLIRFNSCLGLSPPEAQRPIPKKYTCGVVVRKNVPGSQIAEI